MLYLLGLERYAVFKFRPFVTFNEALDEFYVRITVAEKAVATAGIDKLRREAERHQRIVAEQERLVSEAEAKAGLDQRIGDVIYSNFSELQGLLDRFQAAKAQSKDWNVLVA